MIEKVSLSLFVFLVGLIAGKVMEGVSQAILGETDEGGKENENEPKKLIPKSVKGNFIPFSTAFVTLLTWLLPVYQQAPLYIFMGNIVLVWLLIEVGLVDYFTRRIYPHMLLGGVVVVAIMLTAATFFGAVVGLEKDNLTGRRQVVQAGDLRDTDFANFAQLWPLGIVDCLAGLIVAGLVFGGLYFLSRILAKEEVFGSGDVLLAGFIGLSLGFQRSLIWIALSTAISLIATGVLLSSKRSRFDKKQRIAFGPFLCAGAVICLMFGPLFNF